MASPPSWMVDELAERLWHAFRGRKVTLDRFGRPNYLVTRAFARQLLSIALRYGVEDPLHEIDWEAVIDPDISREENLRRFEDWLSATRKEYVPPNEEVERAITELERYLWWLQEELGRAPEEARPSIEEEIRRVRQELEGLRGRGERGARTRKAPKPAPPPPKPVKPLPLEELRARVEYWLRRIPRVYRIDWLRREPYVARISMHSTAYQEVLATIREWGGKVVKEVRTKPPLKVVEVDFSHASPPPVALPPAMERWVLWSKFSAILTAFGLDPSEYRDEFDAVLEECEARKLTLEECQERVERLARELRPPPKPIPVTPAPVLEELRRIERRLNALERAVAWRPSTPEEVRAVAEALYLVEPGLTWRVDEAGHPFIGPDDKTLTVLKSFLDRWAVAWFMSCPACRVRLPGGYLTPVEFAEHLIRIEAAVPPMLEDWLRRFAVMLQEAEERGYP